MRLSQIPEPGESIPEEVVVSPTPTPRPPLKVKASLPYWDQDRAFQTVVDHPEAFDHISLFWYFLGTNGEIRKYSHVKEDRSIVEFAHDNGLQVSAIITNLPDGESAGWDSDRVEKMLGDAKLRQAHIDAVSEKLSVFGFNGVIIDFEKVDRKQRGQFSSYIADLAGVLDREGKFVGVSLHHKTGEEGDDEYFFQDWKNLSKSADELYIMAYGEHWDGGEPGPIASSTWVSKIIEYTKKMNLPSHKFHLGIPLYGYDWKLGSSEDAKGLTHEEVQRIKLNAGVSVRWDDEYESPFFKYTSQGKDHEVWFENADSVASKIELADQAGFAGISFWRLGGEDSSIWSWVKSREQNE